MSSLRRIVPASMLAGVMLISFSAAQISKAQPRPDLSSSAQRGITAARAGNCREALPLLRKSVVRVAEKNLKHDAGLAGVRCAMLLNDSNAAIDLIRLLTRDFPNDPEVLYASVHAYSDLSTQAAQRLAAAAPDSPQAHQLNAEALEPQGKWDEAESEYRAALKQDPRLAGIHFRLGRLLLSKPNPGPNMAEDARKEFQQELEIDPTNAGAEFVLGELARQAQQWDEAIGHFSRATKLDTLFADAFLALGSSLVSVKRFPEAVPPLETAVKLEPQNPAAHYGLATAYSRAGRKADADREFLIHKRMMEKRGTGQGMAPEGTPDTAR